MKKNKWILYIDDSGERRPHHNNVLNSRGDSWFALGGILVKDSKKTIVVGKYKEFCKKWNIDYPLHSSEIRVRTKNFKWLEESVKKSENFMNDLSELLTNIPVLGFAAVANKNNYNKRYLEKYGEGRWWLCESLYPILIERVVKYVTERDGFLEIRYESAGKTENNRIERYAKNMKMVGNVFKSNESLKYDVLDNEVYKKIILGRPKRKPKNNLFIQIADLFLYPMVRNGYDNYVPWNLLFDNKKVIDSLLSEKEIEIKGIKYYCFEK